MVTSDCEGHTDVPIEFTQLHGNDKLCVVATLDSYLERTKNISTTQLKKSLTSFLSIPKNEIINALSVLEVLKKDLE